jgi:uncharacterized protein (TIGR03790 family)
MKLFFNTPLLLLAIIICHSPASVAKDFSSSVIHQPTLLEPKHVAVVYNQNDPDSTEVARYYIQARQIPDKNLIPVKLPVKGGGNIGPAELNPLKATIEAKLTDEMQVMVLMWKTPFAVRCNSITSALTLGFDEKQCENGCSTGKASPYFNSGSRMPYRDHKIRPSMLLPTDDVAAAKALIDRGVLAGFNVSEATGYFLRTSDTARSRPRERFFPPDFSTVTSRKLRLRSPKTDFIRDKKDIMFYLTGLAEVKHLETLNFLPGAIADHLTSAGGILDKAYQMQITRWLDAGATGSYGAVAEPCNHWQKFPNPQVLMSHYLAGETLIEAYWKSVAWPAQGLFIGEPLAAPYQRINLNPNPILPNVEKNAPSSSSDHESSL